MALTVLGSECGHVTPNSVRIASVKEKEPGLSRSRLVAEALNLIQEEGLDALSMRALMAMVHVIAAKAPAQEPAVDAGSIATIALDSGSRGVLVRPGIDMQGLVRTAQDGASAAPAIVRGERVVVRRLRGVGYGEIELNPRHPWRFQIQGATWNTVLEVGGLDVRAIKLDSGAAKVECYLPRPRGEVPIEGSGGVGGLRLHRPRGVAVAADISPPAPPGKIDDYAGTSTVAASHRSRRQRACAAPDPYYH